MKTLFDKYQWNTDSLMRLLPSAFDCIDASDLREYAEALVALRDRFSSSAVTEIKIPFKATELEGLLLTPAHARKKLIIQLRGNGEYFQQTLEEVEEDAHRLNCSVLTFNYPSVGNNEKGDLGLGILVDSVLSAVAYAVETLGIAYEDIILKGHSLGAALGTEAARLLFDDSKAVFVFNGRSFDTLEALGLMHAHERRELNFEPGKTFQSIPSKFKDYIAVEHDPVIPMQYSLHGRLLRHDCADRTRLFTAPKEYAAYAHTLPLSLLANSAGQTAADIFYTFAERAFSIHPEQEKENNL